MQKIKSICAVLLTLVLLLTCTGCDFPPPVEGAAKLADITVPEKTTVGYMWYMFPFSAERANAVFFGDQPYRKIPSDISWGTGSEGYEVIPQADSSFVSSERWAILHITPDWNHPEGLLDGARTAKCLTFSYVRNDPGQQSGFENHWTSMLFQPECGNLLQAIENHPDNDAAYDTALSDSATKLAALGYTDVECLYSTKVDVYGTRILYRAMGLSAGLEEITSPYYVVRYALKSDDIPELWEDGMAVNHIATATFFYNKDGLYRAEITGMPSYEVNRTEKVRYTPEEALRLIPEDWFRKDCILVDAYYEQVQMGAPFYEYNGCWTFRFVAPSELHQISDERYDAMLELGGIAGRYMEMQCQVSVNSGTVIGGTWAFSRHLIHEFNGKQILIKQ